MTLHEAIEKLLKQNGRGMTTTEIATELNKNLWYQKKDGSKIQAFQIHGRTKNYAHLFTREGAMVFLIGSKKKTKESLNKPEDLLTNKDSKLKIVHAFDDKSLVNPSNFKNVKEILDLVPNKPGVYCIQIRDTKKLPRPFSKIAQDRNQNIIYIGIATTSLKTRFLHQELLAKGHGTFFRSMGAILGFRPEKGSLLSKKNKRNYTFNEQDENQIIHWIKQNFVVNWMVCNSDLETVETSLIRKYSPLLNIAKNPLALNELKELRAECVRIANS